MYSNSYISKPEVWKRCHDTHTPETPALVQHTYSHVEKWLSAGKYLGSGVEVANGVGFEILFILPAQHGSDDDDNEGYNRYGSQHCSNYPQVVRRALDHSWTGEKKKT